MSQWSDIVVTNQGKPSGGRIFCTVSGTGLSVSPRFLDERPNIGGQVRVNRVVDSCGYVPRQCGRWQCGGWQSEESECKFSDLHVADVPTVLVFFKLPACEQWPEDTVCQVVGAVLFNDIPDVEEFRA